MYRTILSITLLTTLLSAGIVVPDDYLILEDKKISYIYSMEYQEILEALKAYQRDIINGYEREYGYKLDDRLYVGLASSNNQIANGFSTQFPFNEQVFYGAGAGYIDYFCFSSWLKTLIIHETAHNFQLNPKYNDLSKISHKVLGNTPFSMLSFLPLFPVPNVTESSFILEGNGVMNESRYGNGGRLFSGYALAEVVALAKAGQITPELMYNPTLSFPYDEKFYLVGGFFQQFLVDKFGVDRVNSYFKTYATQPFPFFTNWVFQKQFGQDFETLLVEFVQKIKKEHSSFKATKGKVLAKSQTFVPLNSNAEEIYTLISDKKSAPKVFKLNRENREVSYLNGSWRIGELFKVDGRYYSQSSAKTSPIKVTMALFDKDGYILNGTEGKIVQGYSPDKKMVYFDILKSLETPQLYIEKEFYTQTHSSVYLNKSDLYYFKQEGEKRVLYKNHQALFDYQGHYGFVTDVSEDGTIYFIASSQNGSSVYALKDKKVQSVIDSDDVIEFKIINSKEALVVTIGAEGYSYQLIDFQDKKSSLSTIYSYEIRHRAKLFGIGGFSPEQDEAKAIVSQFRKNSIKTTTIQKDSVTSSKTSKEYRPVTRLKQSSLNQSMNYTTYRGFGVDLQMNFADPLMQNSLSIPLSYNNSRTILGFKYDNMAYPLKFGTATYGVYKSDNYINNQRDYGVDAYINYPFLATGYWRGEANLAYTKAYDNIYREPLTFSVDIVNSKQFGISKYANSLNALSLFTSNDRDSSTVGALYSGEQDLIWQSYIGLKGAYLQSDKVNSSLEKGIELSNTFTELQSDKGTLNIPSFTHKAYAKGVKMAEISFKKVFDGSFYNYSLPISLQRESIYIKVRFYDIDFTDSLNQQYIETTVGLEADLLFIHKLPLPLTFEYIYNPDTQDKEQFRILIGGSF